MKRDFAEWLLTFTDSIANYRYYIDFETAYDVISAAKADTSYTKYSAIQVTAATNAFSKLEQTMKDELNINYDILRTYLEREPHLSTCT